MDSDYNCWEGWELWGKPVTVILRGEPVIEDQRVVGSTTRGRFLERRIVPELLETPIAPSLTGRAPAAATTSA